MDVFLGGGSGVDERFHKLFIVEVDAEQVSGDSYNVQDRKSLC